MFTSISQESLETNLSSSQRTSKYNLLAILFFLMGAPHIYSFMQRDTSQRKLLKIFYRLSLLIIGLFAAGMIEMYIF